MYSVNINIDNSELENFIQMKYGDDENSFIGDFLSFIKTESHIYKIKNILMKSMTMRITK